MGERGINIFPHQLFPEDKNRLEKVGANAPQNFSS